MEHRLEELSEAEQAAARLHQTPESLSLPWMGGGEAGHFAELQVTGGVMYFESEWDSSA